MPIREEQKNIVYSLLLVFVPVTLLFILVFLTKVTLPEKQNQAASVQKTSEEILNLQDKNTDPFSDLEIEARYAIVKDLNTGEIIFQKGGDEPWPLASLTKIMTAVVSEETFEKDSEQIKISWNAINQEGNSFLSLGEIFAFKNLANLTLVASSNDGAAAIAETIQGQKPESTFTDKMNSLAKEAGMEDTYFLNETGLDIDPENAGAMGTAKDVANLLEYSISKYPQIFEATRESEYTTYSKNGILHQATNTNAVVSELPNLLASKTGYTDLAGGNLAVVVDPGLNRPIAIVVLGSSINGRFSDTLKIANLLDDYFDYKEQL